ncbi:MAG TPA: carbohydrate ABC transporter permease [Mobilitalea sp.]|nr:carbohydrate ABC transporter permease [Mobilitalea sp.]
MKKYFQIIINIIMALITLCALVPFLLLVITSISSNDSIIRLGYSLIPKDFTLEAYAYIWKEKMQIFNAYGITVCVTAIGTIIAIIMTLLYAYVLAKPSFPGKSFFSFYIFFTMLFNGGLVPTYIMYTNYLHIKNTILALIIPGLLLNAFNVILVRTYIQNNVPASLTEAAKIDGAGEFKIFARVVLPMAKPIIATVGLFIGVAYWNDWQNGLYYITDNRLYSTQQLLNNMMKNIQYLSSNSASAISSSAIANIPQATVRMAIAVIGILPILLIYPFVQKYFVKGIALGAVKG